MKLTKNDKVYIIIAYQELTPMAQLAKKFNVTRQAIYKILKQAGIDTSKQGLSVSCTTCGKELVRDKFQIRKQKNHFCDRDCYTAFLQAGNGFPYIQSRHGQRIARSLVSKHFDLKENYIVHHENRNCLDNRLKNLMVFRNQGDHIRYHRGFDVEPVWNGALILE